MTLIAVNCLETDATAKTESGVMGTPSSRFEMPYPRSYTIRPFRPMPTPQPGESDLFHSANSRSTRSVADSAREERHAQVVATAVRRMTLVGLRSVFMAERLAA